MSVASHKSPMFDAKGDIEITGDINQNSKGQHLDLRDAEAKTINFGQMDDVNVEDEESEDEAVLANPEGDLASQEGTVTESPQVPSKTSAFRSEEAACAGISNVQAPSAATNPDTRPVQAPPIATSPDNSNVQAPPAATNPVTLNTKASPKAKTSATMFEVGGSMKIKGDVNQNSKGRHIDMRGVKAGTINFGRISHKKG